MAGRGGEARLSLAKNGAAIRSPGDRPRRNAFPATMIDDSNIAIAATSGVTCPRTAIGTAIAPLPQSGSLRPLLDVYICPGAFRYSEDLWRVRFFTFISDRSIRLRPALAQRADDQRRDGQYQ
jgi:hypothetical protein